MDIVENKLNWIDLRLALDADGLGAYPFGKVYKLRNQITIKEAEKINQQEEEMEFADHDCHHTRYGEDGCDCERFMTEHQENNMAGSL